MSGESAFPDGSIAREFEHYRRGGSMPEAGVATLASETRELNEELFSLTRIISALLAGNQCQGRYDEAPLQEVGEAYT